MMTPYFADLIPYPRQMTMREGTSIPPCSLRPHFQGLNSLEVQDFSTLSASVLNPWLKRQSGKAMTLKVKRMPGGLATAGNPIASALKAQSYELMIDSTITLTALTYQGLQLGIQTLKQILEHAVTHGTLPHCHICDRPRLATRGIHIDLAREMEYREAHLFRVIEHLAYLKINTLHLYLENKFAYPSAPEVAPQRVITPKQAHALCQYARRFGITIIPQIPTLGHVEHFLHGKYAELREDPKSAFNLCPTHPKSRPFLAGLIADVADAFQSPFIHIGYDESHSGVCRRCRAYGSPEDILAEHLNWLNSEVKKHGARAMVYGDKFLSPEDFLRADAANGGPPKKARAALQRVSRDILITDWHYTAPYGGTTRYLVKEGFEVHIASGTSTYWHDSIALNRDHHWIVSTIDEAVKEGATGALNTNWEFYRGQFFDNYWYFQGLLAERSWTSRPHDYVTWGRRFTSRFWGVADDYYSELAGLAETISTERRRLFLDEHVLAGSRQARRDFTELGEYLVQRARLLQRKAIRHADTLSMLDMPGQIIRYGGIRSHYGLILLERALNQGHRAAAIRCLETIRKAAKVIAQRLEDGYRRYGGAVVDRQRIANHIHAIRECIQIIKSTRARAMPRSVDRLLLRQQP